MQHKPCVTTLSIAFPVSCAIKPIMENIANPANMEVAPLTIGTMRASRRQSLLNLLYEDIVISAPHAGPKEKKICIAASPQTFIF